MNLRARLILAFAAATIPPVAITWWTSVSLLERSLALAPHRELDTLSKSLEKTGRELYQRARVRLAEDAASGRIQPVRILKPEDLRDFWDSGRGTEFSLAPSGNRLELRRRSASAIEVFETDLGDVNLNQLTTQYAQARAFLQSSRERDLNRGFTLTFALIAALAWSAALAALVWFATRLTRPVRDLTRALHRVAAGDFSVRIDTAGRTDELGVAIGAYNDMAEKVEQSREKLIHVTRLSSWQTLARKMAHELKNSLTPIRLTMEEIAVRYPRDEFVDQASAIVVDEVTALERRVRAFSELASEPPVQLAPLDVNSIVEERVSFLRSAHPEIRYQVDLAEEDPAALADADLVRGVLTNLLENAAHAAGEGGAVMAATWRKNGTVFAEVHDSGPGLPENVRSALFEPAISFKKGGMGLGLSIARRSAVLCGGDLSLIESRLGGAAFRLTLPTHHHSS